MGALEAAIELFRHVGSCFVATADARGLPHLATATHLERAAPGVPRVRVRYWFCPRTVENLEGNTGVSVTIWDPGSDVGYQLLGQVVGVEDAAYLDGVVPPGPEDTRYPSVERVLLVRVGEVLAFHHAPHSDRVLDNADQRFS